MDWMRLVLADDARMIHAGTISMALIVDAPLISAGADFKDWAVDASIARSRAVSMALVSEALMTSAETDLRLVVVNAPLICTGADSRLWKMIAPTTHAGTDSMLCEWRPRWLVRG